MDVWILKVYRYMPTEEGPFKRELFDAITFNADGCSSPLGPDEDFEIFIEKVD